MRPPSKTTVLLLTAGCFLAFLVFGATDNLKGPTLPALLEELHFGYGTGANILFSLYIGFVIATLVTGVLADRFGLKMVMLLAGVFMFAGVTGYSLFSTPLLLSASLFTVGLGLGALEVGPNSIIVALHPARKGLYLNLMSVMHGLGSMLAPLLAGALLSAQVSWRSIYRWDLVLVAAFTLYFLAVRFPPLRDEALGQVRLQEIPRFAFRGALPWFYLAIAAYVAVEVGMASWLVTYLQQVQAYSIPASSRALSLFFGMMMLGRFLGGFVVHRLGYLRSVLLASLAALICLGLGLFGPPSLAFLLSLTAFFFSIIFPTLTAAVSDAHHQHGSTILGVLFTFAGLGGLAGPWLVGWGSALWGLHPGFSINLLLAVLLTASLVVLNKGPKHEEKTT